MAPTDLNGFDASLLSARQYSYRCRSGYYYSNGRCHSGWSWYGRWIFAAVLLGLCLIIFFLYACITARRRRKNGMKPMFGTGWMARNAPHYNNPQGYNGNPQGYNNNNPPPYGPPPGQSYPMNPQATGTTFQTNDGYYGQHEGIQQPKNAYAPTRGDDDYAAPPGPPPTSRP